MQNEVLCISIGHRDKPDHRIMELHGPSHCTISVTQTPKNNTTNNQDKIDRRDF
jgi:hypothetical protein